MSYNEFNHEYKPIPRRGFTSLEAGEFLKKEFPDIPEWTCWYADNTYRGHQLRKLVGKENQSSGRIGKWGWSRVTCSYPNISYWDDDLSKPNESTEWVGTLRVQGPDHEDFLLFSFMNSQGVIGDWYFTSTRELAVLDRFAKAVEDHFIVKNDKIIIEVFGGSGIQIDATDDEAAFLPEALSQDIEQQVFSFFEGSDAYRRMGLRYRRGFLFVGRPGTGKTMFLRHLIRQCHSRYKPAFLMLNIRRDTTEDDIGHFFFHAIRRAPSLAMLEDMDSLTKESRVSRANFLSQLDGMGSREGMLVVGTTNNPGDVDPALIHRPSRFDRVWHFELPDQQMRLRYLESVYGGLDRKTLVTLAERSSDWSFAYLNELRTTAAIISMDRKRPGIGEDELNEAFRRLELQFHAGRNNHVVSLGREAVGFKAA